MRQLKWPGFPWSSTFVGGGLAARFRSLFTSADIWLDADHVTLSAGKIASWVNVVDPSNVFSQANPALRVNAPSADAAMAGALTATWSVGGPYYDSNRAPATTAYRRLGTGVTEYIVFVPTAVAGNNILWADGGGGNPAAINYYTGNALAGQQTVLVSVGNFSGGGAPSLTTNVGAYYRWQYSEVSAPKWSMFIRAAMVASGSVTNPGVGVPVFAMRIGATPTLDALCVMRARAFYSWRRVLTPAEHAVVQAYIARQTGVV